MYAIVCYFITINVRLISLRFSLYCDEVARGASMILKAKITEPKLLAEPFILDKSIGRGQTKRNHLFPEIKMGFCRANRPI